MDPISIGIEIELGSILLAAIGGIYTYLHNRHSKEQRRQRERHHQERLAALRAQAGALDEIAEEIPDAAPVGRRRRGGSAPATRRTAAPANGRRRRAG